MTRSLSPTGLTPGGFLAITAGALTTVGAMVAAGWSLWRLQQRRRHDDFIYLDYNGTTPVYGSVVRAMLPYLKVHYGNPSSSHRAGDVPRRAVDLARHQILVDLLGCDRDTTPLSACLFTACGTESDNLAIHLALMMHSSSRNIATTSAIKTSRNSPSRPAANDVPHIVTCNVEHPAIDLCLTVNNLVGRCTVTYVPVQPDGRVSAADMIAAIQPNT
jgi:cysteine desulfurase